MPNFELNQKVKKHKTAAKATAVTWYRSRVIHDTDSDDRSKLLFFLREKIRYGAPAKLYCGPNIPGFAQAPELLMSAV